MKAPRIPLVWLSGEIQTPPFGKDARIEAGTLLRRVQRGDSLSMPHSRPMPSIGARVHELRVTDEDVIWRIVYRIDDDAVVICEVFAKKTPKTPVHILKTCKARLRAYDAF